MIVHGSSQPVTQPMTTYRASPATPMTRPLGSSRPACSVIIVLIARTSTVAVKAPPATTRTASGARTACQAVRDRPPVPRRLRTATQAANAAATGPVSRSEPITATMMFSTR